MLFNILNKMNGQTLPKKSTASIIKIRMEYLFSPSRFKLLLLLTFYVMFDHSSYSNIQNYKSCFKFL
jgi:hypothetical protein